MPNSGQALALYQWAQMSNIPRITAVTDSLYQNDSILKNIPLMTEPELEFRLSRRTGIQAGSRPIVSWVPLNSDPVLTTGIPTPFTEQIGLIRNGFRIDYLLQNNRNNIGDPVKQEYNFWMKMQIADFNYKFLYNDKNNGDPNAIVGLNARLADPNYQATADMLIDAGGVVMTTAATGTNGINFERYVDMALTNMGVSDGQDCVILVGATLKRAWSATTKMASSGGGFKLTEDAYGRDVETYKKAKVVYAGRQQNQMSEIITATELNTGGQSTSSNFTSVYIIRFGKDYLHGWQPEMLSLTPMGRNPITNANYNFVVNWGVGLIQQDIRSFSRIFDIAVTPTS